MPNANADLQLVPPGGFDGEHATDAAPHRSAYDAEVIRAALSVLPTVAVEELD